MYATLIETVPNLNFEEGLPNASVFIRNTKNSVDMDDFMAKTDGRVENLLIRKSHQADTSVS